MGICNFAPNKREKFIGSLRSNILGLIICTNGRSLLKKEIIKCRVKPLAVEFNSHRPLWSKAPGLRALPSIGETSYATHGTSQNFKVRCMDLANE